MWRLYAIVGFVCVVMAAAVIVTFEALDHPSDEEKRCVLVEKKLGQARESYRVRVFDKTENWHSDIDVPTSQAYSRLEEGKEYTFYFRRHLDLVALEPGCR